MFQKSIFLIALLAMTSMTNGQTSQTTQCLDQHQFNWSCGSQPQTCLEPCQPDLSQMQCEMVPCVPDNELTKSNPTEPVPTAQTPELEEVPETVQTPKPKTTLQVTLTEPQTIEVPENSILIPTLKLMNQDVMLTVIQLACVVKEISGPGRVLQSDAPKRASLQHLPFCLLWNLLEEVFQQTQ